MARAEAIDIAALDQRRACIIWEYVLMYRSPHNRDGGFEMARALRAFDVSMGFVLRRIVGSRGRFEEMSCSSARLRVDHSRGKSFSEAIFGTRMLTDEERWQCNAIATAVRLADEHAGLFVDIEEAAHAAGN